MSNDNTSPEVRAAQAMEKLADAAQKTAEINAEALQIVKDMMEAFKPFIDLAVAHAQKHTKKEG